MPSAFSLIAVWAFSTALTFDICSRNALTDMAILLRSCADAGSPSCGGCSRILSAIVLQGIPCSASNGVILVSESGTVFHTWAIIGTYLWNSAYCSAFIACKHLPTNCQTLSIFALLFGLWASVFVCTMPKVFDSESIAVDMNSLAASVWNRRGTPFSLMIL